MKSDTTIAIILGCIVVALVIMFLSVLQMTFDCRKIAMSQKYPAIEIQGICK